MKKCSVVECHKPVYAHSVCQAHYTRLRNHGSLDANLRPHDWGSREKHPLYRNWNALMRQAVTAVVPEWRDLWAFVSTCPPKPEGVKTTLQRFDVSLPIGPGNSYWREEQSSGMSAEAKKQRCEYAKAWRASNPRRAHDTMLKRSYGIRVEDYERMFVEQGGVCAICQKPETRTSHTAGMTSRLAVDHDHATGKVRALLCHQCNGGLGRFDDDIALMEAALVYLRKHKEATT